MFYPGKKWRKNIRAKLGGTQRKFAKRLARLNRCGDFQIEEIDGVRVACGEGLNLAYVFDGDAIVIAEEIFRDEEYNFDVGGKAVVIDIGMNIGLASLSFALREDIEHVYSFEPFKPTFDQALFNFKIIKVAFGRASGPCVRPNSRNSSPD